MNTPTRAYRKPLLVTLGVVILLMAVIMTLELTNTTRLFHKRANTSFNANTPTTGGGSAGSQKGESQSPQQSSDSNTDKQQNGSDNSSASSAVNLVAPTGNFVSAHHISVSTNISSVCNTTPGASCKITFTKAGTTRAVALKATDSNGSAYWNNWSPASVGITAGSWHVQAVATLNGQTKSTEDALLLEVAE
jgi:hypothetical protein